LFLTTFDLNEYVYVLEIEWIVAGDPSPTGLNANSAMVMRSLSKREVQVLAIRTRKYRPGASADPLSLVVARLRDFRVHRHARLRHAGCGVQIFKPLSLYELR
jgi:hypothetical protein